MNLGNVAQGQRGQFVATFKDDKSLTVLDDGAQGCQSGLGRGLVAFEQGGDNVDAVGARTIGQSGAQGTLLHLLGGALVVVTRLGAVDDAAAGEVRRADGALAGVTGALLTERLLTAAGDRAAGLRRVRALAGSRKLSNDNLVHQRNVGGNVKDRTGENDGTRLLAFDVDDVNVTIVSHDHAPFTEERTRTTPFFGPGMAPLISSRPFSVSTAWIVRF